MTITFEAGPIESAPKDRKIMVYSDRFGWRYGWWKSCETHKNPKPYWDIDTIFFMPEVRASHPTHWAEIADMAVTP